MSMTIIDITKDKNFIGGEEQNLPVQCDMGTLKALSNVNGVGDLVSLIGDSKVPNRVCMMTGRNEVILDFWKDFKVCIVSSIVGEIPVIRICKSIPYFKSLRELNNESLTTLLDELEEKVLVSLEVHDIVKVLKENRPTLLRIEGELMNELKIRGRKRMSYDEFKDYSKTEEYAFLRKYSLKSITISFEPKDVEDNFFYVGVPNIATFVELLDFCGELGAEEIPTIVLTKDLIEAVEKLPIDVNLSKNIHRLVYTNMGRVLGSNINGVLEYVNILQAYRYLYAIIG